MQSSHHDLSVPDVAATLYNFTINEETYETTVNRLRDIEGIDVRQLRSELIFLTVVIVDIVLRSEKLHQIHGAKANEIFPHHLNCFKEQTTIAGADAAFIDLLNERGNIYHAIIQNRQNSPSLFSFELADAIAKYCGVTNPAFHLAVMHEFGSLMDTVGEFLETVHLN